MTVRKFLLFIALISTVHLPAMANDKQPQGSLKCEGDLRQFLSQLALADLAKVENSNILLVMAAGFDPIQIMMRLIGVGTIDFDHLVQKGSDAELAAFAGQQCNAASIAFIHGLLCEDEYPPEKYPEWAMRMYDATGKPSSGFFDGNLHSVGSFDACTSLSVANHSIPSRLSLKVPAFQGLFCLSTFTMNASEAVGPPFDKVNAMADVDVPRLRSEGPSKAVATERQRDYGIDWSAFGNPGNLIKDMILGAILSRPIFGLCVPSGCDASQVGSALHDLANRTINVVANTSVHVPFYFDVKAHLKEDLNLSAADIVAMTVLSLMLCICMVGTVVDILFNQEPRKPADRWVAYFVVFSLYTNSKKLFSTGRPRDKSVTLDKKSENTLPGKGSDEVNIQCLNGIKVFSMLWIMLGHTYTVGLVKNPWVNPFAQADFTFNWYSSLINGMLAVDTFFFISGLLTSINLLKELNRRRGSFTFWLMYYLHRLMRLLPLLTAVILLVIAVNVHVASGPFWHYKVEQAERCKKYWWTNLLFINNFFDQNQACLVITWYLACDVQFYLISPLIVWPIWRFKRYGVAFAAFVLFGACVIPGVFTYVNQWPPEITITIVNDEWFDEFYVRPYHRAAPYIYGLLFGYFMKWYISRGKASLPVYVVALCWLGSASIALANIFGLMNMWKVDFECVLELECYWPVQSAFYAALARWSWAVAVSWVVFASHTGHAGMIGKLLALPIFSPLSRLSYAMYLIHHDLMQVFYFSLKTSMYFSGYIMVYFLCGHVVVSFAYSTLLTLVFESPVAQIQSLLRKPKPRQPNSSPDAEQQVLSDSAIESTAKDE